MPMALQADGLPMEELSVACLALLALFNSISGKPHPHFPVAIRPRLQRFASILDLNALI